MPETAVLKDDSTPVDGQDSSFPDFEFVPQSGDRKLSDAIRSTASEIAKRENVPTRAIVDEQCKKALEIAKEQKLAYDFGVETKEIQEQKAALKEWERQQEEKDRDRKHQEANSGQDKLPGVPGTSTCDQPINDYSSDIQLKSNDHILKGHDNTSNRNPALLNRQHSESDSLQLSRKQQQAESHPLTVGSMVVVTVRDRDVHGTIRLMGNIPNVPNVIAGVELVSVWGCACVGACVRTCVRPYIGTLYVGTYVPA